MVNTMPDIETLLMALVGYRAERQKLDEKITELEQRLGGHTRGGAKSGRKRRKLSATAVAHIRAAQKKRWAEYRKEHAAPSKKAAAKKSAPQKPKRKLSAAQKAVLVERLKKARAAKAAKEAGGKTGAY